MTAARRSGTEVMQTVPSGPYWIRVYDQSPDIETKKAVLGQSFIALAFDDGTLLTMTPSVKNKMKVVFTLCAVRGTSIPGSCSGRRLTVSERKTSMIPSLRALCAFVYVDAYEGKCGFKAYAALHKDGSLSCRVEREAHS